MAYSARISKVVHRQSQAPKSPMEWGAKCSICPLKGTKPVYGDGPSAPVMNIVGEAPGMDEESMGIPFCLVPETLVLMRDLTWNRLGNIHVGDEILTFEENGRKTDSGVSGYAGRKWQFGTVERVLTREAETTRVDFSDGSNLIGTSDHRFLNGGAHSGSLRPWVSIGKFLQARSKWSVMRTGSSHATKLVKPVDPWVTDPSRDAGYLAGFFDGEGHVGGSKGAVRRKAHVGFAQNLGPTLLHVLALTKRMGFRFSGGEGPTRKGVTNAKHYLLGGFAEAVRFLGTVRPVRLLKNFDSVVSATGLGVKNHRVNPHVLLRTPAGKRTVIDITTTRGTFIANGFVAHNCGASGEELMKWLEKIGLVRQDVWLSNSVICRPAGNDMKSFLQRSRKEHKEKGLEFHHPVECCRGRLLYELKVPFCLSCGKYLRGPDASVCTCKTPQLRKHAKGVSGPMAEVTVATGNMALESLRGVSGITEHRGYVEDLKARRNELVGVGSAASRTTVAIGGLTK